MLVEPVNPEKQMTTILEKMEKQRKSDELNYPKNYVTLCDLIAGFRSFAALTGNGFSCYLDFFFFSFIFWGLVSQYTIYFFHIFLLASQYF